MSNLAIYCFLFALVLFLFLLLTSTRFLVYVYSLFLKRWVKTKDGLIDVQCFKLEGNYFFVFVLNPLMTFEQIKDTVKETENFAITVAGKMKLKSDKKVCVSFLDLRIHHLVGSKFFD